MAVKGQKPKVYDFLMSIDYGICHGTVDSFNEIRFRDKVGWVGPATVDGATYIEKNELFGGDDGGEGGVSGTVEFYRGSWLQKMSGSLAQRFGLTPDTAPGYRGLSHVFFHGSRPPGEESVRSMPAPKITQNWTSGMSGDPTANPVYSVYPVQDDLAEFIPEDSPLAQSIDSNLASLFMMEDIVSPTGGSQVWSGGIRAEFRDAAGNLISTVSQAADPAAVVDGVGQTKAAAVWPVPPLTRQIRYKAGITRNYTTAVTIAELRTSQGWLTNYFGDTFEFANLDAVGKSRGFKWGTNNPYLQPPQINVTRLPQGLSAVQNFIPPIVGVNEADTYIIANTFSGTESFEPNEDRTIKVLNNTLIDNVLGTLFGPGFTRKENGGNKKCRRTHLPDANPAHMIYECMTNAEWGKGDPEAAFDTASYVAAAETLLDEHFGLSMMWNGQDKIENFVGEVLDHIKGMQFQDPQTGLWTLKLLRDDYDPNDCFVFDESNCTVHDVKTRLWGETINKIIVTYTDPESEEEATVEDINLANVAVQGGVLSDTRDYHGVRNPWLAKIIARRDLAESSAILTSLTIKAPRSVGVIKPGDVVRVVWPRHEVDGYFRVNEVDPGSSKAKNLTIKAVQDVFSVTAPTRAVSPVAVPSQPNDELPEDIPEYAFLPTPYYLLTDDQRANLGDAESTTIIFAADPDISYSDISIQYIGANSVGANDFIEAARISESESYQITDALVPEVRSTIDAFALREAAGDLQLYEGQRFFLGDTWATHEIIALELYDYTADTWTVIRGVHDTIPMSHPIGTYLRRERSATASGDNLARDVGEEVEYFLLPRTFGGTRLDPYDATPVTYTVEARHFLPYRPANVSIDGNDSFTHTQYLAGSVPANFTLTWANRNRDFELGPVVAWDADNVTPEIGQTTTIRFWGGENFDILDYEITGLTVTTTTVSQTDIPSFRDYEVEFIAVREGEESGRNMRATLEIERLGYGNNYGYDYGENDG